MESVRDGAAVLEAWHAAEDLIESKRFTEILSGFNTLLSGITKAIDRHI